MSELELWRSLLRLRKQVEMTISLLEHKGHLVPDEDCKAPKGFSYRLGAFSILDAGLELEGKKGQ